MCLIHLLEVPAYRHLQTSDSRNCLFHLIKGANYMYIHFCRWTLSKIISLSISYIGHSFKTACCKIRCVDRSRSIRIDGFDILVQSSLKRIWVSQRRAHSAHIIIYLLYLIKNQEIFVYDTSIFSSINL